MYNGNVLSMHENRMQFFIYFIITEIMINLYLEPKDLTYVITLCMTVIMFVQMYEYIFKKYFWREIKDTVIRTNMESCDLDSMNGLDCATLMAHMYYNGYLKIILPSPGTTVKGLVEKIEDYEDSNNIKISVHKLFILIPSSSYIPPDLKEASNNWMESAKDLPNEIRNRAGVKRREYHSTVYKIYPDGLRTNTPLYLVVEGASPLLTFYEMMSRSHEDTCAYRTYHKNIIKKFYEKLKHLLENDPECSDVCELIYYDDYENGKKVNIAKVLLNRL